MNGALMRMFVQRIYALDLEEEAWLAGLASAAEEAFGVGLGTFATTLDALGPASSCARAVACAGFQTPGVARIVEEGLRSLPAADLRQLAIRAPTGAVGGPARSGQPAIAAWLSRFGASDLLTLLATDPSGVAVVVATNLREKGDLTPRARATLARLAAHTSTARQLRDASEEIDATYTANGTVLDAEADAKAPEVAAELRAAVLSLAALRAGGGERALAGYTSRVDARWSVLARFDSGGDEYVVARRSLPATWPIESLTARERQVVCYLAVGHSQKEIAYELGLAPSTVRVTCARATKKLGVRSSKELAERAREHANAARTPP